MTESLEEPLLVGSPVEDRRSAVVRSLRGRRRREKEEEEDPSSVSSEASSSLQYNPHGDDDPSAASSLHNPHGDDDPSSVSSEAPSSSHAEDPSPSEASLQALCEEHDALSTEATSCPTELGTAAPCFSKAVKLWMSRPLCGAVAPLWVLACVGPDFRGPGGVARGYLPFARFARPLEVANGVAAFLSIFMAFFGKWSVPVFASAYGACLREAVAAGAGGPRQQQQQMEMSRMIPAPPRENDDDDDDAGEEASGSGREPPKRKRPAAGAASLELVARALPAVAVAAGVVAVLLYARDTRRLDCRVEYVTYEDDGDASTTRRFLVEEIGRGRDDDDDLFHDDWAARPDDADADAVGDDDDDGQEDSSSREVVKYPWGCTWASASWLATRLLDGLAVPLVACLAVMLVAHLRALAAALDERRKASRAVSRPPLLRAGSSLSWSSSSSVTGDEPDAETPPVGDHDDQDDDQDDDDDREESKLLVDDANQLWRWPLLFVLFVFGALLVVASADVAARVLSEWTASSHHHHHPEEEGEKNNAIFHDVAEALGVAAVALVVDVGVVGLVGRVNFFVDALGNPTAFVHPALRLPYAPLLALGIAATVIILATILILG